MFHNSNSVFLHSLRQHRFNEVFLQLLMDQLKLTERLLAVQKTIMDGHSQVIYLQIKQNRFFHQVADNKSNETVDNLRLMFKLTGGRILFLFRNR